MSMASPLFNLMVQNCTVQYLMCDVVGYVTNTTLLVLGHLNQFFLLRFCYQWLLHEDELKTKGLW